MEASVKSYDTNDIIYALATAWGKSAIAVVRVSGDGCIEVLSKAFSSSRRLKAAKTNTAVYGRLADPKDGLPIDDVVVTVYRDGHGYTGEEAFEVSCHGGLQVVRAVLSLLEGLGFRKALAGEFTLRAFLHGKMDLTKAEAVEELIESKGRTGQTMALNRLNGSLFKAISNIKGILVGIMSTVEVQLDYSEDEIGEDLSFPFQELEKAMDAVGRIKATYSAGRLYSQGARIVLAGPTNAGKSSLFNYFLKEERSIVSSVEGTTRDFIEAQCTIDGIPVRLYDTAGFRDLPSKDEEGQDGIEAQGMKRSRSLLEDADIILYMVGPEKDGSGAAGPDGEVPCAPHALPVENLAADPRCIVVYSKADIVHPVQDKRKDVSKDGRKAVSVSVVTGEGFQGLCSEISRRLTQDIQVQGDDGLVIESERQRIDLERCQKALDAAMMAAKHDVPLDIISMDIQEAIEALGEITGEVTTDDILDRIFGTFCVGK